ncbi:hypothetical protein, partial [Microcystis aeruginosa]|uniref:hypothetical protein n=1 Tax=Microcystis aeruginosa TaxID=1126 RepID=UPI00232B3865
NILVTEARSIFVSTSCVAELLTVTNPRSLPSKWTGFYLNLLNPNSGYLGTVMIIRYKISNFGKAKYGQSRI